MGKLNNKGFGMTVMLIFMGVFIVVLIAVMIIAHNNGVEQDSKDKAFEKEGTIFVSPTIEAKKQKEKENE